MESCLNLSSYKDVEDYKNDIDNAIQDILNRNERLTFASVVKNVDITPITISKYPELRMYILENIKLKKEIKVIDDKINRATSKILNSKENLTFMGLVKRCRFSLELVYKNPYIKESLLKVLKENTIRTSNS
ncbi:hypothetical protein [Clostridium ihumii]|uniref:hypothetical protein n=1 Tax=Clostridium ihumii TaxID=1470356 RepID=UPI00058B5ACB|nr:hypothetical protein [Clostridium ihumii]